MILASVDLLKANPTPTDEEIRHGWRATSAAAPATRTSCAPVRLAGGPRRPPRR